MSHHYQISCLQADDDTYLRVSGMLGLLSQLHAEHFLLGNIHEDPGRPERVDEGAPWHVTTEEWPRDEYPYWADGGCGFVLSIVRPWLLQYNYSLPSILHRMPVPSCVLAACTNSSGLACDQRRIATIQLPLLG